ncbi:MAG: phosphoadenosine phosphosulfate reductase family protein [Pyrodictiaceae archaeon]
MERYPIIASNGSITGYVTSGGEFTALFDKNGARLGTYMWLSHERAIRVDEFVKKGFLIVGNYIIDVEKLLEDIPWPLIYVSGKSVDEYIEWVKRSIGNILNGKKVLVNFSGGKDSLSALYVLAKLSEVVDGLKIYAAYVHVSFLEPTRNIEFVSKAAEKLGAELILLEADRSLVKKRLLEDGLPYRGWRWCTYLKLKPIKILKRRFEHDFIADGDRMTEAFKRFKRLYQMSPKKPRLITGNRIRPIYVLTLLDVIKITRSSGLIHPDYLEGLPRVACLLCPYIVPHELASLDLNKLEDPGLAEHALRKSYDRDYRDLGIPWEDFMEQHLWRHNPRTAYILWRVKRILERHELEEINAKDVNNMYKSIWLNPLPRAREVRPDEATTYLSQAIAPAFEKLKEHIVDGYREMGLRWEAEEVKKV